MKAIGHILRASLLAPLRGPLGWVRCAILFLALYGIFHLLGWRDDTAIISGTGSPAGRSWMVYRGVIYGVTYIGAVVVCPILLLGAAIRALERVAR